MNSLQSAPNSKNIDHVKNRDQLVVYIMAA